VTQLLGLSLQLGLDSVLTFGVSGGPKQVPTAGIRGPLTNRGPDQTREAFDGFFRQRYGSE
jgi:hypothetical protein